MAIGCYVIGENIIHLSLQIPQTSYYATENYVGYFLLACKKLPGKLDCLVIVDPHFVEPKILQEIFTIAHGYANVVHIIPAIVAILQYAVMTTNATHFDDMLILIDFYPKFYVCALRKNFNTIFPILTKTETIQSLKHTFYARFKLQHVNCFSTKLSKQCKKELRLLFPSMSFLQLFSPSVILSLGSFYQAVSLVEEGRYPKVMNFTPGIFNGNTTVINRCTTFPLQVEYHPAIGSCTSFHDILVLEPAKTKNKFKSTFEISKSTILIPAQLSLKKFIIEYNQFGLLSIKEPMREAITFPMLHPNYCIRQTNSQLSFSIFNDFLFTNLNNVHVWSLEKQCRAFFDFSTKLRRIDPFDDFGIAKRLFTDQWLSNIDQNSSIDTNLHMVFVDRKMDNYVNGPKVSIAPSYIGILQYYVTYFKPSDPKLIILITTKKSSKFYVLAQRSPLCYTVTYISEYYENQPLIPSSSRSTKTRILYIYERGMNQTLSLDFLSINNSVTRFELSNLDEVMFYGGAIYALHNSSSTLLSPYVTVNPLLDPEDNNCDGLNTVSRKTSTCFYEIEAFFHGALKSINSSLFWGDTIAILLKRNYQIFIYFFVHVNGKFLFKFDITVPRTQVIDHALLHFADIVIVENSEMPKMSTNFSPRLFNWNNTKNKKAEVEAFLKNLKPDELLIYNTPNYSDVIFRAKNNCIFENVIFKMEPLTIEFESDKCRIPVDDNHFIALRDDEWIPMYISFSQTQLQIGHKALKDFESFPKSVIYDFVKLIGITSKTLSSFDPEWTFELVEMGDSEDPKLGYKVQTHQGFKIISPEMALTIFLKQMIYIYETYTNKNVEEIVFKFLNPTVTLTEDQKEAFLNAAKLLKKNFSFN